MFNTIELQLMRQALDIITISGKDAKLVANLQIKLEQTINQEVTKEQELQKVLSSKSK